MVVWGNKECALFPLGLWGQIDARLKLVDQCLWIITRGGTLEVKSRQA